MIASIDQDFAIVWWESHVVPRKACQDIFDKLNYGECVPKPDIQAACQASARELVNVFGLKQGYKTIRFFPLAVNNGDCYGIEARLCKKGLKQNQMPFLFSVGVVEDNKGNRWLDILDVDAKAAKDIAKDMKAASKIATKVWEEQLETVTATDLTAAINLMLKQNAGVMRRKGGIVWTIPKKHLADYLSVGKQLQQYGVELTGGAFSVDDTANDSLVKQTTSHISHHLQDVLAGLIEGCDRRKKSGTKSRANGRNSRMEEWQQCAKILGEYRELLGPLVEELDEALESAKCSLADEAMAEFANS